MASIRAIVGVLALTAILAMATLPALAHGGAQAPPADDTSTDRPNHNVAEYKL